MDSFFSSQEAMQYAAKQIHGEDNWRLLSKAFENHYKIQHSLCQALWITYF